MANKNNAKVQFTAETKEFNDAISKSNEEISNFRAELKLNATQMKANGTSIDGLEKKHELLEKQLEASQNKIEAISEKIKSSAKYYGENSSEVLKLKTQLANAKTEEEKLQKAIADCNEELEEQSHTTETLGEGFTVLKGVMANLITDGIENLASGLVNVSTSAFALTNDIDKAMNSFVAKTGESKNAADEFEEAMMSIYNDNFGESFEDIASAMSEIKQQLGDIKSDALEDMTKDALVLRDTFEFEVNESTRAAKMLMDQWGLSSKEAYNLIAQGAQNGLNKNDDLLDSINEYSVHYKQLGLSADDFFNSLANGTEAGTFSVDKLGDAMKEFGIRVKDGSDSTAKAFEYLGYDADKMFKTFNEGGKEAADMTEILIDDFAHMPDSVEKTTAGVALFGTMWEDLGEKGIEALGNLDGDITKTKDVLTDINSVKYDDLGSAIEGIKRNLETAVVEPMNDEVMPAVNEFIEDIDWQGVGETVGDAFSAIAEGALSIANGAKEAVSWMKENEAAITAIAVVVGILTTAITAYNVVQGIKLAMDAAEVATVWGLVAAQWAHAAAATAALAPYILVVAAIAAVIAIIIVVIKYWDEIVVACKNAWEAIKSTLVEWGAWINTNVIQPIAEFFKGLWEGITEVASTAWDGVKTFFAGIPEWFNTTVIQPVINFFKGMWQGIKNTWETAKTFFISISEWFDSTIIQPVINLFKGMWEGIQEAWDFICNIVQVGIMLIGSILSAAFQIITIPFIFIWENCKEYIIEAWNSIKSAVSTAINAVKDVIIIVFNAIKNFITPIWDSIKSAITTVVNTVKDTVTKIWNSIKTTTTTVFNAVKSTSTKVWNSIKSAIITVVNTVKDTVTKIWNSIKTTTTTVFNAVKSTATKVWNDIKSAVTTVVNAVKNTVLNVWNSIKSTTSSIFNSVKSVASSVWNSIKSTVSNVVNGIKSTVSSVWNGIKSTTSSVFNGIKSTATSVWNGIKTAITKPIEAAKTKVKSVVDSIKGFFKNMKLSLPNIKLPHFRIVGKLSIDPPSVPKLSIDWYKNGGIMTRPTIFGFNGLNFMAGGEAGPEAILPIDRLEGYIVNAIEKTSNSVDIQALADKIERLANRPINLNINGKQFAQATASDTDSVNGLRSTFKSKGLILD